MAKENNTYDKVINQLNKGINLDYPVEYTSQGNHIFALNAVNSTSDGNIGVLSTEPSNEVLFEELRERIILGTCILDSKSFAVFSVDENNTNSEIGIYTEGEGYKTEVNDLNSEEKDKLYFNKNHSIASTSRIRRGCFRTIYFVDGINVPRYYDFDNKNLFLNSEDKFVADKFTLQRTSNKIPNLYFSVENTGGNLPAGTYNIAFQYCDARGNSTSWNYISKSIIIYNDSLTSSYKEISGSINKIPRTVESFENTNKSIVVNLSDLDTNYKFYRLAFICKNSGVGLVNKVGVTDVISISNTSFKFTGESNFNKEIPIEEIIVGNSLIHTASEIEQIGNRLVLGNIKQNQIDYCKFQKYASKIKSACVLKEQNLNPEEVKGSNKDPLMYFNNVGYTPGELYSFGIVYVLESGITTPAFHIPGMSSYENIGLPLLSHPMSTNNEMDYNYFDKGDFWGNNANGEAITSATKVRHHRFPTRKELGINLIDLTYSNPVKQVEPKEEIKKTIVGKITKKITAQIIKEFNDNKSEKIPEITQDWENKVIPEITSLKYEIRYTENVVHIIDIEIPENGNTFETDIVLDKNIPIDPNHFQINLVINNEKFNIEEETFIYNIFGKGIYYFKKKEKTVITTAEKDTKFNDLIKTKKLGIKFYDIELPSKEDVGEEVIGYYIVRQEKTSSDKSIIDSCLLTPNLEYKDFITSGLLAPEFKTSYSNKETVDYYTRNKFKSKPNINKNSFSVISLTNKFNQEYLDNFDTIDIQGYYYIQKQKLGTISKQEALKGEGYFGKPEVAKVRLDNEDGADWWCITRNSYLNYSNYTTPISIKRDVVENVIYLDALGRYFIPKNKKYYYNMSMSNTSVIMKLKDGEEIPFPNERTIVDSDNGYTDISIFNDGYSTLYYYAILKRHNTSAYSNFMNKPYFKETNNIHKNDSIELFNGDSFVSGINYNNIMFYEFSWAMRAKSRMAEYLSYIGAGVALAGGIVGAIFTGGASLAGGVAIAASLIGGIAGALTLTHLGLKENAINNAYLEHFSAGLQNTISDNMIYSLLNLSGWGLVDDKSPVKLFFNSDVSKINSLNNTRKKKEITGFVYGLGTGLTANTDDISSVFEDRFNDDTVIWIADGLSNIYLESEVNADLRLKYDQSGYMQFIPTPLEIQNNNNHVFCYEVYEGGDKDADVMNTHEFGDREPKSTFELSIWQRSLYIPNEQNVIQGNKGNEGKLSLRHAPLPESYLLNPDYINTQVSPFYHLAPFYDCDSQCRECFPHRIIWSNKSQDEELEDSYFDFLANNYKDIPSDTGKITNLFSMNNNLYIHTENALYVQQLGYQEKMTNEATLYIGTGEFASLPPQKLIDSHNKISAGLDHRTSAINTANGYFFISNSDSSIYHLTKGLENLSLKGISMWSLNNINLDYEFIPSPQITENFGYNVTYDNFNDRVLFTKKGESSFTLSYSLKSQSFISYHSYIPDNYISFGNSFLSVKEGVFYNHKTKGNYLNYFNTKYSFVIEYVVSENPVITTTYEDITFNTDAYKETPNGDYEDKWTTFNSVILYNSKQSSKKLNLTPKKETINSFFMNTQIKNNLSILDKNEEDWTLNSFRNDKVISEKPLFNTPNYTLNKELNKEVFISKEWTNKDMLRDKYMIVNLEYVPKEDDIRLTFNYCITTKNTSIR